MPRKKLTIKQRDFIKEYVENGGNGTKAALKAYDTSSPETASAIAKENLQKPQVRASLEEMMQANGLDDESLMLIHHGLLNDKNPLVRIKALEMAYKLKGKFETATQENNRNQNFQFNIYSREETERRLGIPIFPSIKLD